MSAIECKNVCFSYEGKEILSDISFKLNSGDYLSILGENGSGKSTLVKGLLKLKIPSSGEILFGKDIKSSEIGYLPQRADMQKDFPASVFEVVLSGRLNSCGFKPFYSKSDKKIAVESLEFMGISELKKSSFQELSGGQQQRVLLARALCATKKMIILDEPTAGLDPAASESLYNIINDINKNLGTTVIMVSHDIEAATNFSSHILHLGNNSFFFGSSEEYLQGGMKHV